MLYLLTLYRTPGFSCPTGSWINYLVTLLPCYLVNVLWPNRDATPCCVLYWAEGAGFVWISCDWGKITALKRDEDDGAPSSLRHSGDLSTHLAHPVSDTARPKANNNLLQCHATATSVLQIQKAVTAVLALKTKSKMRKLIIWKVSSYRRRQ